MDISTRQWTQSSWTLIKPEKQMAGSECPELKLTYGRDEEEAE